MDRELLDKTGLLQEVDSILKRMGIKVLATMDEPTYPVLTKQFLASLSFASPKMTRDGRRAIILFRIGNQSYPLTMDNLCNAYGFEKKKFSKSPPFEDADAFWRLIGDDKDYKGSSAKITLVRHPILRYISKLLANT